MQRQRFPLATVVFCSILLLQSTLRGSELYEIANDANASSPFGHFYKLDLAIGAATAVGTTSVAVPRNLASDTRPGSFAMWTMEFTQKKLLSVNPANGATTLVGTMLPSDSYIRALAFDVTTGTLYGVSWECYVYSINRDTGAATGIGSSGWGDYRGLACDNNGTLFGIFRDSGGNFDDWLVIVDRTTGQLTYNAMLQTPGITDIAFRPEDNVMFAVSTTTNSLYTMDPMTGATTLVGALGAGVTKLEGLAFTAVPEPGELMIMLGSAALLMRRKARRPR